jgi:DNA-binding NarL/FixJ family response regulator
MSGQVIRTRRQLRNSDSPSAERRVRVVIADHDGLARSMLRTALGAADGIATVATTGDGREALELVRYYRPTVLIVDTALLSNGRIELIAEILSSSPETRVVTISVDDDRTAMAALRAGAIGHLSKDVDPKKLGRLVARAAAGEPLVPRRLTLPLLELARQLPEKGWRPLHSRLTTREWEIIELISDGASTQDIADRLVLSPTTVYSHVKSLLRKLGVHSRREAVMVAWRLRQEEAWGQKIPHQSPSGSTTPHRPFPESFTYAGGSGGASYGSASSPARMAGRKRI